MELRHLATFVAVAEERSFTRASDRLHVVQSAVSAGVRTLERELGAALFDRTTHQVLLTDAGHALLPEARATLAAARAAREAVDAGPRGPARDRDARASCRPGALGAVNVAGLLAAFHAEHPTSSYTPVRPIPPRWPRRSATAGSTSPCSPPPPPRGGLRPHAARP